MSMYYNDHLTATRKKMWSSFYLLVDAAIMVSEEESKMRFLHVFPRKPRSSLVKRRYSSQQNINGASSSLIDLNQIPTDSETEDPQNHLQWLSSSSSSCFITADSEKKTLQNPSSEHFSITSLLDYNTDESEKTDMKDPPNPNSQSLCLTENTSRKKRAVQVKKRTGVFKKAKIAYFTRTAREIPEWLVQVMRDMKEAKDAKLIFEKTLFTTDVNPTQNRLSMPFNNLIRNDFLTPVELRIINEDINNNKKIGVGAILVDQRCEKWGVMLKRWEMKKESGKGSWNYNLICGWNDVVRANGLKDGDTISLWSFRCCGVLCFAMEQSSSSLVLAFC